MKSRKCQSTRSETSIYQKNMLENQNQFDNALYEEDHVKRTKTLYRLYERWGAGVETQQIARGEIGGWGRVPFNEPYAPSLSTIYDGA